MKTRFILASAMIIALFTSSCSNNDDNTNNATNVQSITEEEKSRFIIYA